MLLEGIYGMIFKADLYCTYRVWLCLYLLLWDNNYISHSDIQLDFSTGSNHISQIWYWTAPQKVDR